ncbi:MAG TPA: hypothetical protein VNS31_06900 [Ramlibacter sp.]|jgi:hypothetical protein|nr:hypothetical protein [Ramlibacter sp.]
MASQYPILNIEAAPGDPPRAVEQLNGDLLVPAAARTLIAQALLLAEDALPDGRTEELARLAHVRCLLGVVRIDTARQTLLANLGKIRPV